MCSVLCVRSRVWETQMQNIGVIQSQFHESIVAAFVSLMRTVVLIYYQQDFFFIKTGSLMKLMATNFLSWVDLP